MAVELDTPDEFSQHGSQPRRQHEQESHPASYLDSRVEECLERGTRLLATLVPAARAARLEAEVGELQAALVEARNGAPRRLERWLSRFDASGGFDSPVPGTLDSWQVGSPASESSFIGVTPLATPQFTETEQLGNAPLVVPVDPDALGWAPYLIHARRRLQELARTQPHALIGLGMELTADGFQHTAGFAQGEAAASRHAVEATAGDESEKKERSFDEAIVQDATCDATDAQTWTATDQSVDEVAEEAVDAPAEELDLSQIENLAKEVEQTTIVNRPMLSGFSLSLLAHLCLLVILFVISVKLPDEPASLGSVLVSVAAPGDDLELTPQFEALEPIEMELDAVVEPSIDPAKTAPSSEATALAELRAATADAASLMSGPSDAAASNQSAAAMLAAAVGHQTGRAAGSRSGTRGAPTLSSKGGKFFGAGAGGNFFCYVVDSSGSMRGAAWESAKAELVRSIGTLSEKQRFYIVFFAKEFSAIPEPGGREPAAHGLTATKENIEHARRWIETVKLDRGGPPNDALELAIAREPDAIYLLTDGVTQVDVCGFLRERNRTSDIISGQQVRVPIHAIAYHSLEGQQLLRQLAHENDGQFHYVPAP